MRFRLRSLLIFATLVAIAAGWCTWPDRTARGCYDALRRGDANDVHRLFGDAPSGEAYADFLLGSYARRTELVGSSEMHSNPIWLDLELRPRSLGDIISGRRRFTLFGGWLELTAQGGRIRRIEEGSGKHAILIY